MKVPAYGYEIKPRPANLGGGWNLELTADGKVVGGGVFPVTDDCNEIEAWNQASEYAEDWLSRRPQKFETDSSSVADSLFSVEECTTLHETIFFSYCEAADHSRNLSHDDAHYERRLGACNVEMERLESINKKLFSDEQTLAERYHDFCTTGTSIG